MPTSLSYVHYTIHYGMMCWNYWNMLMLDFSNTATAARNDEIMIFLFERFILFSKENEKNTIYISHKFHDEYDHSITGMVIMHLSVIDYVFRSKNITLLQLFIDALNLKMNVTLDAKCTTMNMFAITNYKIIIYNADHEFTDFVLNNVTNMPKEVKDKVDLLRTYAIIPAAPAAPPAAAKEE